MATTNGNFGQVDQYKAPEQYGSTAATESANSGSGNGDLSKDEIGWYFVEQYYTTLSRSPEKLHLFYNKRSQLVSGMEAEVTPVSVGRPAIQERIKDLDFQDCKVRVSNVDSQASDEHIIIQVIGEISNKTADLQKFVQTFVLAQQPTGYFVLNDIFRFIKEDVEEGDVVVMAEETEEKSGEQPVEASVDPVVEAAKTDLDATVVDKKLEEVEVEAEAEAEAEKEVPSTNGTAPVDTTEHEEPAPKIEEPTETPEAVEKEVEEEDVKEGDKPKEPVPTPAISRLPSTTGPAPAQPASPAKPMSWASRVAAANAGNAALKAAVPAPAPKTASTPPAPAPAQTKPTPAAQTTAAPVAPAPTPAAAAPPASATANKENEAPQQSGWQTAGSDHSKRQNRPQSVSGPVQKEGTMGYVRNVTEAVKTEELRSDLASFGELSYFDINRQKNCAFVEFATEAGYLAAVAANPHMIAGESIMVEPRRPKSNAYGGNNYAGGRGGMNNRGRGGFEQGRQGSQRGRGEFGNRGGRGGANTRGRGTGQTANA